MITKFIHFLFSIIKFFQFHFSSVSTQMTIINKLILQYTVINFPFFLIFGNKIYVTFFFTIEGYKNVEYIDNLSYVNFVD